MKKLILLLLLAPFISVAQDQGMHFEHTLSWKEVQEKAKAENKFIFMDCLTTWCGPCKFMSANIFPQKAVGEFYNSKFINVKVQLDSTAADAEEIKKWYQDGHDIAKQYEIRAYPTYLIFDPNGNIVHRFVGSSDETTFLKNGANSVDPEKQYYTQLNKYKSGQKDPVFLKNLALISMGAYDMKNAGIISEEYLATQSNLYTKENLEFIDKFTQTSKDKGFALLVNNSEKVNAVLGKGKAEAKVMAIIMQEEAYPIVFKRGVEPNWEFLSNNLITKYPKYAEEVMSKSKVMYFQNKGDWNSFATEIVAYMNKYGDKANESELNSYAWTVFENCKDMTCVGQALEWSKRSFQDKENHMFMDTYANILHKLGNTKEAILWEKKALALVKSEEEKKTYQEALTKMEKGEKTWKD